MASSPPCARPNRRYDGVVIWHEAPFAVGANLQQVGEACAGRHVRYSEQTVDELPAHLAALKYAQVPTVAAVQGMALGGGCEFLMHAGKRVMALESYIGLVEAGVGLIPAGGGCKEFAVRAAECGRPVGDAGARCSTSCSRVPDHRHGQGGQERARKPRTWASPGRPTRSSSMPTNCCSWRSAKRGRWPMPATRPPLTPRAIPVAGRSGIATLEMMLVNMKEGGMISAHDYRVAKAAATALCGGDVETGSLVDEEWLLTVEREHFVELLKHRKPSAHQHMLETGKPLRN